MALSSELRLRSDFMDRDPIKYTLTKLDVLWYINPNNKMINSLLQQSFFVGRQSDNINHPIIEYPPFDLDRRNH